VFVIHGVVKYGLRVGPIPAVAFKYNVVVILLLLDHSEVIDEHGVLVVDGDVLVVNYVIGKLFFDKEGVDAFFLSKADRVVYKIDKALSLNLVVMSKLSVLISEIEREVLHSQPIITILLGKHFLCLIASIESESAHIQIRHYSKKPVLLGNAELSCRH
jgi:hypothetical protein